MAKRTIVQLVDDLDGRDIPDGGGERVDFAVRGVRYRIDLSAANVAKFEKALAPFVAAAVKANGHNGKSNPRRGRPRRAPRSGRASAGSAATLNGSAATLNGAAGASRESLGAIRTWARKQGHSVSDRGRIPAVVVAAFDAAH